MVKGNKLVEESKISQQSDESTQNNQTPAKKISLPPIEVNDHILPLLNFDIFDYTILGLTIFHVLINPYTKVEETFITNNMYDHLVYGLDIPSYDFHEFPGVVERSFIPSLIISAITYPFHHIFVELLN